MGDDATHESDVPLGPSSEGLAASSGVKKRPSRRRGERAVGLYERLLQEAAKLPEDPNRERNERMSAYFRNLRGPVPEGGGYVTKEELEQEQERYLTDIRKLRAFLVKGPSGIAGGYWFGYLKSKPQAPGRGHTTLAMENPDGARKLGW
jgi:hypothetical protein